MRKDFLRRHKKEEKYRHILVFIHSMRVHVAAHAGSVFNKNNSVSSSQYIMYFFGVRFVGVCEFILKKFMLKK